MAKVAFTCGHCGGGGEREAGGYHRRVNAGLPLYCCRDCGNAARTARAINLGWYDQRFTARDGSVHKNCTECGCDMWLPPSKADEYHRCGAECSKAWRKRIVAERARSCETCGEQFIPRPNLLRQGQGRYCSQKCNKAFHAASQRPEVWAERIVTMREKRARGEWTVHCGEANWKWKGGAKACRERRRDDGREAATLRQYRRNNPDKVREFAGRRKDRKMDRLPYGTIPKLRERQKNRCAICSTSLRHGDHLDHILPLARGGRHEPGNLQLLCPPCNLHKSDRDPIKHMQSLGRLL
jgi:5-methylcytosine-specific restriction endonuclease McrA